MPTEDRGLHSPAAAGRTRSAKQTELPRLTLDDLKRGMLIRWDWPEGLRELAARGQVRPIGRVITRDDLPTMSKRTRLAVQTVDDPTWVIDPAVVLAKGGSLYRASPTDTAPSALIA